MIRRARPIAIVAILAAGALGIVSSTQTWLTVVLAGGAHDELAVPGAVAVPVLAPLSLAVLALGLALSIVGIVLRYAFGAVSVMIAVALGLLTWQVVAQPAAGHVASAVTAATGITGETAIAQLVSGFSASPWPAVTFAGWIVLGTGGVLTLATAHTWRGAGRRYRTGPRGRGAAVTPTASRPHDAIDDWDDLSRGEDPTA